MQPLEVRRALPEEFEACYEVRRQVFVDEQQVPEELELDEHDATATHFVARRDGRVVGTARLRLQGDDAKAERVAVLAAERAHGVGRLLMAQLELEAAARGHARMVLNAQEGALDFYTRLGYRAEGEPFLDAGIPHRRMTKALGPVDA